MPVTEDYEPKIFNCNGDQQIFSVSWRIFQTSDAKIYLKDTEIADPNEGQTKLTETTHYTISAPNNDYSDGFKITTVEKYTNQYKLVATRDLAETQTADYIENDPFPSKSHENVVDKLTMLVQELKALDSRLLRLAITSAYKDLTLPDPSANEYLAWKSDLTGLKNIGLYSKGDLNVSDWIKNNLLDDANAEAALTTLGFSAFIQTLKDDEDAATALTTLGFSAFIKTLVDDADADTLRTSILAGLMSTKGDLLVKGTTLLEKLSGGALDTVLKGQGAGEKPIFEKPTLLDTGIHIGNDTRSTAGNQVITGVPFESSVVIFIATSDDLDSAILSIGFDNGTVHHCVAIGHDGSISIDSNTMSIYIDVLGVNDIQGYISAMSADGFTITWALTGVAAASFKYLCFP